MKDGKVEHKQGSATVTANTARPLAQAIAALREEYGWVLDYEDPPYTNEPDLVDAADPQWRATHPNARAAHRIAGGFFQSQYSEDAGIETPAGEEAVLRKIVSEYNSSGNPGKFSVRVEGPGRFAIVGSSAKDAVGQDRNAPAVLDTRISLPGQTGNGLDALNAILAQLSSKSGKTVVAGMIPAALLSQSNVTIGGENRSARDLLIQTFDGTGRPLHWRLLFDPINENTFVLNVAVAERAIVDTYGRKRFRPIDEPSGRRPN